MLDAKKLLDALIGSAAVGPASKGASEADLSSRTPAGGNDAFGGLGDLLGSVVGQLTGQHSGQPGSVTEANGDLISQARQYLDTPQGRNIASAVAGGLAGLLLGSRSSGKSVTSSAAGLGGMALIGGLAYKAYQNWQAGAPAYASDQALEAPPADSAFGAEMASQDTALVLLRATIAAAASDGHIDTEERGRIVDSLTKAGVHSEVATFLDREFADPASITQLASAATSEEIAMQIYTAARLAIEPDTPAERAFLKELSGALSLPGGLIAHIDATASAAKESSDGASASTQV